MNAMLTVPSRPSSRMPKAKSKDMPAPLKPAIPRTTCSSTAANALPAAQQSRPQAQLVTKSSKLPAQLDGSTPPCRKGRPRKRGPHCVKSRAIFETDDNDRDTTASSNVAPSTLCCSPACPQLALSPLTHQTTSPPGQSASPQSATPHVLRNAVLLMFALMAGHTVDAAQVALDVQIFPRAHRSVLEFMSRIGYTLTVFYFILYMYIALPFLPHRV